jgi:glycosyltransferase involved in cell wall biosynthesis
MKIGVAIPCFDKHLPYLFLLLDSIETQTLMPDKVCVSCSSTDVFPPSRKYSFPLEIVLTKEKHNAAQNRNIAMDRLREMDYISFMDADDIMHPQRIEVLRNVFEDHNCQMILHNYQHGKNTIFRTIRNIEVRVNTMKPTVSGGTSICSSIFTILKSPSNDPSLISFDFLKNPSFIAVKTVPSATVSLNYPMSTMPIS